MTDEQVARSRAYDDAQPQIWRYFEAFTKDLILAGRTRFGAELIWNRIRWETAIRGPQEIGMPKLKLNNNHKAYYARKFMAVHPECAGFFETRERRKDLYGL